MKDPFRVTDTVAPPAAEQQGRSWMDAFEALKEKLFTEIDAFSSHAKQEGRTGCVSLRESLAFLRTLVQNTSPLMYAAARPKQAERAIQFAAVKWDSRDDEWLERYKTFSHVRLPGEQVIVWIPGTDRNEELSAMYANLSRMRCSRGLTAALKKFGPVEPTDTKGRYIWFCRTH